MIPVNVVSQTVAATRFDNVVSDIEQCVVAEAAAGTIIQHWQPCGDEACYDDGRCSGTGCWTGYLAWVRHPAVALEVEGKRRPYRTRDGRFFIRVGSEKREATPEELQALLNESKPVSYETIPALGAGIADIDEAHLWSFVRAFEDGAVRQAAIIPSRNTPATAA